MLPWSVCARSAQHRAPAVSYTGASHKTHNPYNGVLNCWVHVHIQTDMYTKDIAQIIINRSHTTSHAMWAYHFNPVASVALPEMQGITNENFK